MEVSQPTKKKVYSQIILSTLYSYIGVILGLISYIFFIPIIFDANDCMEYYGVTQLILAYVAISSIIARFSTPNYLIKYFPVLKKASKDDLISILINFQLFGTLVAFICMSLYFYINTDNASDFNQDYIIFFYPVLILDTLTIFLFNYSKQLLKSAQIALYRDIILKGWNLISLLLLYYNLITYEEFIPVFFIQYLIYSFFSIAYIKKIKTNVFTLKNHPLKTYKYYLKFGLFNILAGSSAVLISKVDILMIETYLDLKKVGYYAYGIYLLSIMLIPQRSINSVIQPIISEKFQRLTKTQFRGIYNNINIANFIITATIYLLIVFNFQDLLSFIGSDNTKLSQSIDILMILGIGKIIESLFTVNNTILNVSQIYKYDLYIQIFTLVLVLVSNLIFIPLLGILGAALATAISFIVSSSIKALIIHKKFKLQPINFQTLIWTSFFILISILLSNLELEYIWIINITIKALITLLLIIGFSFISKTHKIIRKQLNF